MGARTSNFLAWGVLVPLLAWMGHADDVYSYSTFPAPPKLKPVPESAKHPMVAVPTNIDKAKLVVSDTYVGSDKKETEVPVWFQDGKWFKLAGSISPGTDFVPEAITTGRGRMFYGTSKLDSMKVDAWVNGRQGKGEAAAVTLYIDGGYLKRTE